MVLILVNEGLIDLNATINNYIPQYEGPGKNQATIHQMLTHTSGIPNHGAIPNLSKKRVRWIYDSDQYLELVKETALKFEPGAGFEYSGIAYNLLAIICEKVTQKSFKELLKQLGRGFLWAGRKIRSAAYSVVGMIIDAILLATAPATAGGGKIAQAVVWAIIVMVDIYEFITGDYENPGEPLWMRVLFFGCDVL